MPGSEFGLRKSGELLVIPRLRADLAGYVVESKQIGRSNWFVLVTYNRVGEGFLEPRTVESGQTLDIYSGRLTLPVTLEQVYSPDSEYAPLLTLEQVADFYNRVGGVLSDQIKLLAKPSFFFVYGGEGEKYQLALNLIGKLSYLAWALGKEMLAKFYLLTCGCDLGNKARMADVAHSQGRLRCIVYNPAGTCGGLEDLQTIADAILR